jgi:hypothetical protein
MKSKIIGLIFVQLSFFYVTSSFAQQPQASGNIDKPVRVEIPAKSTDETYHIVTAQSSNILLYFRSIETVGDSLTKWYISLYDKDLSQVWMKSFLVRTGLDVKVYSCDNDVLTLVFLASEKTKDIAGTEMIVRLDCKTGSINATRCLLTGNVAPQEFRTFRDRTFLGYNLKNEPAHIQIVELGSGKVIDCQLTPHGTPSTVTGFLIDTLNNIIYATVLETISKNKGATFLQKIDFSGTKLSETEISTISPLWEIRNPQLILINPDDLLVIATYSAAGKSAKNNQPKSSSGFFTCRIRNGNQTNIQFKNFLELKNFQYMMGDKDLNAIRKKASKKNRSIDDYATEVSLLVHPLIIHNDQVIFMGESYIPEYHSENFTEFDFYGRPYINTYNVFDGYRYTSAIIAGFDKTGNLKWDNSMEIRNLISTELDPKVNVYFSSSDTMVLCYSSEARIASKIIWKNEVVEKLDFSAMDQMYPEDKMLNESKNNMVPWYGPFFLCYGYQEIKNINSSENKKRLVFYFTKVKFD